MKWLCVVAAAALLPALVTAARADAPAPYAVVQTLSLGAATHWDYAAVDPGHRRLYLTRGDHVDVLSLPSGQAVGQVTKTEGVHGVTFDPLRGLGFTSNGKAQSVTVFDLASLQTRTEIALAGSKPDAILFESLAGKVYVFEGDSSSVEVIDAATLKPVAMIHASGKPEFAAADGHGHVFFNVEDRGEIEVIDTASDRITATWPLAACEEPTGLALDAAHGRLFSACRNGRVVVTDASSGRRVADYPIGAHPDAVVFDAATQTVLTSCGDGTLSVVSELAPDRYLVRQDLATAQGARTIAIDGVDQRVYLPTVQDGRFIVVVAARRP